MTPLGTIEVLLALFGLSWLASALWAGTTVRRLPPREHWALYAAGFAATASVLVAARIFPAMRERLWPPAPLFDWSLVALCIAGIAICWWARLHLGKLWSGGIVLKEGHRVVDTGPYAFVRHPIYSGGFLVVLSFVAARAYASGLLVALIFIVFFERKARLEERLLVREFGDEYERYRARVGMLVPRFSSGAR